ncbi:MAG: hypothetical protein ABL958_21680 [Bdellovibrionia bacterium]
MRPGRELDVKVAQEVLGHKVFVKNKKLFEETPVGERPLRLYDSDLNDAWEVADRLHIALLPVEGGQWFGFVGRVEGWKSPTELLEFLQAGDFTGCGASVGKNPAKVICQTAMNAITKRTEEARGEIKSDDIQTEVIPVHQEPAAPTNEVTH